MPGHSSEGGPHSHGRGCPSQALPPSPWARSGGAKPSVHPSPSEPSPTPIGRGRLAGLIRRPLGTRIIPSVISGGRFAAAIIVALTVLALLLLLSALAGFRLGLLFALLLIGLILRLFGLLVLLGLFGLLPLLLFAAASRALRRAPSKTGWKREGPIVKDGAVPSIVVKKSGIGVYSKFDISLLDYQYVLGQEGDWR